MTYPTLNLKALANLQTVQENIRANPDWLDASPYDSTIRELLKKLFESTVVTESTSSTRAATPSRKRKKGDLSEVDLDEVEKESKEMLAELKKLKDAGGERLDTASKLQIIKTQAQLIEKILSNRERASNIRQQSHFQQSVLDLLEDLLNDDQRHEFITRMEAFL